MPSYRLHATTIVGYAYCADLYCPICIVRALPTGEGGAFDGWAIAEGYAPMPSTEDNLSEIAQAFGINRANETTFDSGDFPKVVFASDASEDDYCAMCHERLLET